MEVPVKVSARQDAPARRMKIQWVIEMTRSRVWPVALVATIAAASFVGPTATSATSDSASLPNFGISVAFSDSPPLPDPAEMAQAQAVFSYVAGLGADAVSLDFPFYMSSQSASSVSSGSGTPSPETLKGIIEIAENDGLRVQLRPLMSEANFDGSYTRAWRGTIVPADINAWFSSYWTWLRPYLVVAKQTNAASFVIGSELTSLISPNKTTSSTGEPTIGVHNFLGDWLVLRREAQSIVGDRLMYAASHFQFSTVPDIAFGYDAYAPVIIPSDEPPPSPTNPNTVNEFVASMESSFQMPRFAAPLSSTTLEEVGIPAAYNAWEIPNVYAYAPGTPVERWVQADWDTAMCTTFIHDDMAGIYFWAVDFNTFTPSLNASADLYNFERTETQTAISSCFSNIRAADG